METKSKILKVYKFQQTKWMQSEHLQHNDIAVVVDQTVKRIYFWRGKNSKAHSLEMAKKNLLVKKNQYSQYQYHNNQTEFPSPILKEISRRLE